MRSACASGSLALHHVRDRGRERRHHLEGVADDAEVRDLEDRGVGVLVDRDDRARGAHAGEVLDRAADADGDVERRAHDLAGLADLLAVRPPAGVDDGARGADRGHAGAERGGEVLDQLEVLRLLEAAAAGDDHLGLLQRHLAAGRRDDLLDHGEQVAGRRRGLADLGVARAARRRERARADRRAERRLGRARGHRRLAGEHRLLRRERAALEGDADRVGDHRRVEQRGDARQQVLAHRGVRHQHGGRAVGRALLDDGLGVAVAGVVGERRAVDGDDLVRAGLAQLGAGAVQPVAAGDDDDLAAGLAGELQGRGDGLERRALGGAAADLSDHEDVAHGCAPGLRSEGLGLAQGGDQRRHRVGAVADDLAGGAGGRQRQRDDLHAARAELRGLLDERLLLSRHDSLKRWIARLVNLFDHANYARKSS